MSTKGNFLLRLSTLSLLCFLVSHAFAQPQRPNNRIGVTHSASSAPEATRSERTVFLSVPHLRQEKNLCVPTSAAMVLGYFGDPRSPRELKTLSRGGDFNPEGPFSDFTMTWFRDLLFGMQRIDYKWKESTYMNNAWGFRSGLDDIKQSLRQGHPVLVDTTLYGGHTFVVAGFDDSSAVVHIVDPNIGPPGLRQLNYEDFEKIWSSAPVGFNGRGAIFTRPK